MDYIIIDSARIQINAPAITWHDSRLSIKPPRGAGCRQFEPKKFVLHWTGGENAASTVHTTLQSRGRLGLGVDFCIEGSGVIYQYLDPAVHYGYHVGSRHNPTAIGVEICSYGFRWPVWTRWSLKKVPKRARDRTVYETRFRGVRHYIADFYPAQKQAVFALVDALTKAFPRIERKVPKDLTGEYKHHTLPRKEATNFCGVCGHYHLSKRKTDPGPRLIEEVDQYMEGKNEHIL